MKIRGVRKALPEPAHATRLLVRVPAAQVGLFRFLLEANDHLASFTVLDRREALLKLLFSPHEERRVRSALADMAEVVDVVVMPWPIA